MKEKNLLIIGAGVSGLSTALRLLNCGHKVTLWSKEPEGALPTTSSNAYAMWVPVKIDADPRVERWVDESFLELEKLSHDNSTGIVMRRIFQLQTTSPAALSPSKVTNIRQALAGEISPEYPAAVVIDRAPVIDPPLYLHWLRQELYRLGASFASRTVASLAECPQEFDLVVNCSGLGARHLANDSTLFPERVQVVKIKHNGFQDVVVDDGGPNKRACIVPHASYIKLGAVFDLGDESLQVDNACTADILARCKRMVPGFKAELSDVLSVSRALRPERPLTRVELDTLADGRPLIHNYGHDGMGYILSSGIAQEISSYVQAL